jgi:hypothetical protein
VDASIVYKILRPLIDELRTLVSGAASAVLGLQTTFVYRPGYTGLAPNVYTSWPALMAAQLAVQGPKIIQIDDSIVSPAVIPSGTWNLYDCSLAGIIGPPVPVQASCADGCRFQNLSLITDNLIVTSNSSTPIMTLLANEGILIARGGVIDSGPGSGPFILVPAGVGSPANIFLELVGQVGTTPGRNVVQVDDAVNGAVIIVTTPGSAVTNDVVTGAGKLLVLYTESVQFILNTVLPLSQSGIAVYEVADATKYESASYFCEQLPTALSGADSAVPDGYSLQTTATLSAGYFPTQPGLLTELSVSHGGTGNPADAAKSVTYRVQSNGVDVPGASVTIADAQSGGGGSALFLGFFSGVGDDITLLATPSAPLASPLIEIAASLL